MRRGIRQRALRRFGRALRHGLVVSGVCVLIALVTGVSGYAFGARPEPAYGQVPPREPAATSSEVLGRWLRAIPEATALGEARPTEAENAGSDPVVATVEVTPSPTSTPDPADATVVAARLTNGAVVLQPGDRTMVTVSFYYCEEAAGAAASGDGGGFCGLVRDGSRVRSGVAACDAAYLGQRFQIVGDPTGRTYVCADTGSAVHGLHRDIWFLDNRDGWGWQSQVGSQALIQVVP